jgi:hypothetical protein
VSFKLSCPFLFGLSSIFGIFFPRRHCLDSHGDDCPDPDCFVLHRNSYEAETPRSGVLRHPCLIKMTPKEETGESRYRTKKRWKIRAPQGALVAYTYMLHLCRLSSTVFPPWFFISLFLFRLLSGNHRAQLAWPGSSAVFPVSTSLLNSTYSCYRLCSVNLINLTGTIVTAY